MAFECCRVCVAPKRYPGCHGKCPEYLEERARYDALKAADDKKRRTRNALIEQRNELYFKAMKNRRASDRSCK